MNTQNYNEMLSHTIQSITGSVGKDELEFVSDDGTCFRFCHYQDCCENVQIEDIIGDLNDLIGSPIVLAEEVVSEAEVEPEPEGWSSESWTWTFYRFATVKGTVTVRWLGTSNGYYSESVDFEIIKPTELK